MASPLVQHQGLRATFTGIERGSEGVTVNEFRGIKYASVPARFERAQPVDDFGDAVVDASQYGYCSESFHAGCVNEC